LGEGKRDCALEGSVFTVRLPGGFPEDATVGPIPAQQGGRQVEDA